MNHKDFIKKYPELSAPQFYSAFGYYVFKSAIPTHFIHEVLNQHKTILAKSNKELMRSNGKKESHIFEGGLFVNPVIDIDKELDTSLMPYYHAINYLLELPNLKNKLKKICPAFQLSQTLVFEKSFYSLFSKEEGFSCYIPLVNNHNAFLYYGSHHEKKKKYEENKKIRAMLSTGDIIVLNGMLEAGIEDIQPYSPSIKCLYKDK